MTTVLGTSGMTVMDQATGYNTFANGGFAGTRHGITELRDRSGNVIYNYQRMLHRRTVCFPSAQSRR